MKKLIAAAVAAMFATVTVAPAIAADKKPAKVKKHKKPAAKPAAPAKK